MAEFTISCQHQLYASPARTDRNWSTSLQVLSTTLTCKSNTRMIEYQHDCLWNHSVAQNGAVWRMRVDKPSAWATVFQYFRQFKEKQWPSLFRLFCSEAIQMNHCPCARPATDEIQKWKYYREHSNMKARVWRRVSALTGSVQNGLGGSKEFLHRVHPAEIKPMLPYSLAVTATRLND